MKVLKRILNYTSLEEMAEIEGIELKTLKKLSTMDLEIISYQGYKVNVYKYVSKKDGSDVIAIEECFFNEDLFYVAIFTKGKEEDATTDFIKEAIEEAHKDD